MAKFGDGSPAIVMLRLQCRYGHRTEEPFLVAKCRSSLKAPPMSKSDRVQ